MEAITNCGNCGAALEGDECQYCGAGVAAFIRRVKQASTYIIKPKAKPKAAKIIQVSASTASEMREVARQNAVVHREQVCIAKAVSKIDALVRDTVMDGGTKIEFGQIYIRLNKYEKDGVTEHYRKLGFDLHTDITWTNQMPPKWNMAKYDKAYLSW